MASLTLFGACLGTTRSAVHVLLYFVLTKGVSDTLFSVDDIISCFNAIDHFIASRFKWPSQIMMVFWTPSAKNEVLTQLLLNKKEKQLPFIWLGYSTSSTENCM